MACARCGYHRGTEGSTYHIDHSSFMHMRLIEIPHLSRIGSIERRAFGLSFPLALQTVCPSRLGLQSCVSGSVVTRSSRCLRSLPRARAVPAAARSARIDSGTATRVHYYILHRRGASYFHRQKAGVSLRAPRTGYHCIHLQSLRRTGRHHPGGSPALSLCICRVIKSHKEVEG